MDMIDYKKLKIDIIAVQQSKTVLWTVQYCTVIEAFCTAPIVPTRTLMPTFLHIQKR